MQGQLGQATREEPSRWAVVRLLRDLVRAGREGWRRVPAGAPRRWVLTLAAGYAAIVLITLGLTFFVWHLQDSGVLAWEPPLTARLIDQLPITLSTAIWLQEFGSDILLLFVTLTMAVIATFARRPFRALTIMASCIPLDFVLHMAWNTWNRHRPQFVLGGAATPTLASFPSGHLAKTLAFYGIFVYFWIEASSSWIERVIAVLALLAVLILVAISRLRLGAHWPTDLMGGVLIGALWLAALIVALRTSGVDIGQSSRRI